MTRGKSRQVEKILADLQRLADELRKAPEHMEYAAQHANVGHGGDPERGRLNYQIGGLEQHCRSAAGGIELKIRHLTDELKLVCS